MTASAIRAFIAIELPDLIQRRLGEVIVALKDGTDRAVRWVPPNNIHLTLKFLGNVSPANLRSLTELLQNESRNHPPFDALISGLGAFPNRIRPRVIWVGVKAPPALMRLQQNIDRETSRMGYPSEERTYSPHLTLGRISQHATPADVRQIADRLSQVNVTDLGQISVKRLHLFRSDLQPGGAIYTPLFVSEMGETHSS